MLAGFLHSESKDRSVRKIRMWWNKQQKIYVRKVRNFKTMWQRLKTKGFRSIYVCEKLESLEYSGRETRIKCENIEREAVIFL